MSWMKLILPITLLASLIIGVPVPAQDAAGPPPGVGMDPPAMGGARWANLTPEQAAQVKAKIEEMRAQGATPQEIHAAVDEMLQAWGVPPLGRGLRGPGEGGLLGQLTPDQREQLKAKMQELRQGGATPEEIRAAMQEMLQGWGVQPPEFGGQHPPQGRGEGPGGPLWGQLTPEQQAQLRAKMQELRQGGATPEEIRAAMQEMLQGWGVQPPEFGGQHPPQGRGEGPGGPLWGQLTPEQQAQLRAKMQELRQGGATPEEIRAAMQEMLQGWGVQPPN